jgi:hypothetical protein
VKDAEADFGIAFGQEEAILDLSVVDWEGSAGLLDTGFGVVVLDSACLGVAFVIVFAVGVVVAFV